MLNPKTPDKMNQREMEQHLRESEILHALEMRVQRMEQERGRTVQELPNLPRGMFAHIHKMVVTDALTLV